MSDIREEFVEHIISAITLATALAWNSAIQDMIGKNERLKTMGPLMYAITLTIVATLLIKTIKWGNKKSVSKS